MRSRGSSASARSRPLDTRAGSSMRTLRRGSEARSSRLAVSTSAIRRSSSSTSSATVASRRCMRLVGRVDQLQRHLDAGERRAQLVRDIGEQLLLRLARCLDAIGHLVEAARQPAHLVRRSPRPLRRERSPRPYASHRGGQLLQRPGDRARERVDQRQRHRERPQEQRARREPPPGARRPGGKRQPRDQTRPAAAQGRRHPACPSQRPGAQLPHRREVGERGWALPAAAQISPPGPTTITSTPSSSCMSVDGALQADRVARAGSIRAMCTARRGPPRPVREEGAAGEPADADRSPA